MGNAKPSNETEVAGSGQSHKPRPSGASGGPISRPKSNSADRRKHRRWEYLSSGIAVAVEHPGGGVARLLVCARNLSTSGIAFIHSGYLHQGSTCKLLLRKHNGETQPIVGTVASCRHLHGMMHEIGVRFVHEIDVRQFVRAIDEGGEHEDESVTLTPVQGRILYLDDCEDDRELMKFLLQACGAEICAVADGYEAVGLCEQARFAAVLTELRLPEITGLEVIALLRSSGYQRPIFAVTADERPETKAQAIAAGCADVLIKPLNVEQLSRALSTLASSATPAEETSEPLFSSLWEKTEMRPLIAGFVSHLDQKLQQLQQSIESSDWPAAERLCLALKGSAGGFGFARMTDIAAELLHLIVEQTPDAALAARLDELRQLSESAAKAIESPPSRRAA